MINRTAFSGCEKLATFILRKVTVCQLIATDAFSGTPIANGTGFSFEVYDDEVVIRARSYSAGVWYTDYNTTIELV